MSDLAETMQCLMSSDLFVLSVRKGYDSEKFCSLLFNSIWGDYCYSTKCIDAWLGEAYVLSTLEQETGSIPAGETYNETFMEWAGYLYRYWSLNYPQTGKTIYSIAPIKLLSQGYLGWHCEDWDLVIQDLISGYDHAV